MRQRGLSAPFLSRILENADVERPANDNCRLYRMTKNLARALGDDRLARFAVIWSDDSGRVVTIVPISRGRMGARYRKRI
jgi:hypothetical protein